MADFSKYISYFRSFRLRSPGSDAHPGAPVPGGEEHGAFLADFAQRVQQAFTAIETQTNSSTTSEPQAPPNIQALHVSAQNGHFSLAITDQSSGLRRGVSYFIDHADNAGFVNAHTIELGQTRNHNEFLGNVGRYFRGYSAYSGSPPSDHVYFGGQTAPAMIQGGGSMGGPSFLPSQGSGTSAAGQPGTGPGPIQERSSRSGFNWRLQRPADGAAGFSGTGTPAGIGALGGGGGSGGGGSPILPAALYDTYANWTSAKYPPAQYALNTTFTITDWNFVTYIVRLVAGSNKWVYESGTYETAYASKPTTGFNGVVLGANDTGLKFYDNATYIRTWEWGGAAWKYASGELPGGDTSPAVIMVAGTVVPPGYATCDGTAKTITKADATTFSFTTPPFTTGNFPKGGAYTGATITAVVPTISGNTELAATGDTLDTSSGTFLAGAVSALTAASVHAGTTHQHGLTSGNAPIIQPSADPVPAVLMMFAVKL